MNTTATSADIQNNVTGPISAIETGAGGVASAAVTVGDAFEIRYTPNLTHADSVLNITNTGFNGAPLTGPSSGGIYA